MFIIAKLSIHKPRSSSVQSSSVRSLSKLTDQNLCGIKLMWCFHKIIFPSNLVCSDQNTLDLIFEERMDSKYVGL